jgi:hypothetical protein
MASERFGPCTRPNIAWNVGSAGVNPGFGNAGNIRFYTPDSTPVCKPEGRYFINRAAGR